MFESHSTGFWMKFDNGFQVSVQYGFGNYCENRRNQEARTSSNAEVAVFDPAGGFVPLQDIDGTVDDIAGWMTPETVAGLLGVVSSLKKDDVFFNTCPLKLA